MAFITKKVETKKIDLRLGKLEARQIKEEPNRNRHLVFVNAINTTAQKKSRLCSRQQCNELTCSNRTLRQFPSQNCSLQNQFLSVLAHSLQKFLQSQPLRTNIAFKYCEVSISHTDCTLHFETFCTSLQNLVSSDVLHIQLLSVQPQNNCTNR